GPVALFGHAVQAFRLLGSRLYRPAARRLAHDLQLVARDADSLAHHVHDRLARPQLLHVVPGTAAQRVVGRGPQPGPEASGSHIALLAVVSTPPGSAVGSGWRRGRRPGDRVGAGWSMRVTIIALQAVGAL